MIPYPAAGIAAYHSGVPFGILGWRAQAACPISEPTQIHEPILTN
jgi:hypothetical protein